MEEIINKIINKIEGLYDIKAIFNRQQYVNSNKPDVDGKLIIYFKGSSYEYDVKIKKTFSIVYLHELESLKKYFDNMVLFSDYINGNQRNELRKKNIYYADVSGNLYLKSQSFYFFIDGKRDLRLPMQRKNKSFGSAGLKLIFNLLINEEIINKNYRDISSEIKLSLDTISRTIKELESQGFLININQSIKKVVRKKELFEKWVSLFGEILKRRITRGKFISLDKNFLQSWKQLEFTNEKTQWGGESAANLLDHYLSPEYFTIYTDENNEDLLKNYKLISSRDGNIEISDKFWSYHYRQFNYLTNCQSVVHPFLIYADLINTNNPRNYEAAKLIYENYINGIISET